jgi:parvulin-like peptidyl-prolyl isomerase
VFHRGELLAIVNGRGIYAEDLALRQTPLSEAIARENLIAQAKNARISGAAVDRELELLRDQFSSKQRYDSALRASGLSSASLRAAIEEQQRGLAWLEQNIPASEVSKQECRARFSAHASAFTLPLRFHVAHIFLAAHAQTPPEITKEKRTQIQAIAGELRKGADFAQLAIQRSEDEATKAQGGDLGWLSQARIPPEIYGAIARLKRGETSAPFQSHLGFHIFRVLEVRPARALTFDESRDDIASAMRNEKRRAACARLVQQLNTAEYRVRR